MTRLEGDGQTEAGQQAQSAHAPPLPVPLARRRHWLVLRRPTTPLLAFVLGLFGIAVCFLAWWYVTRGERSEDRLISQAALPSPYETFSRLGELWNDHALARNTLVTLRRVTLGFALAAAIGVPLGILAGCFPPLASMLAPVLAFGRNIPMAALIILTFMLFGVGELQKVIFLFLACVAFVISDSAVAISNVNQSYVDTAYTLGATRWQVITKTLVPLALPKIFDSLRLLFGLSFGYIMLAETVKLGEESGGLGNLIISAQRRGKLEYIYLIILIIPLVALAVDRILYWMQRQLFPYRYGGPGYLLQACHGALLIWEKVTGLFLPIKKPFDQWTAEWKARRQATPAVEGQSEVPVKKREIKWRP